MLVFIHPSTKARAIFIYENSYKPGSGFFLSQRSLSNIAKETRGHVLLFSSFKMTQDLLLESTSSTGKIFRIYHFLLPRGEEISKAMEIGFLSCHIGTKIEEVDIYRWDTKTILETSICTAKICHCTQLAKSILLCVSTLQVIGSRRSKATAPALHRSSNYCPVWLPHFH